MCEAATLIKNDDPSPLDRSVFSKAGIIIGCRIMKFLLLFTLTFLAQVLTIHQVNALLPCQVELCTTRHAQQMEDRVIFPSHTVDYCQTLGGYITCLNATMRSCHSMLDFHSARTAANQRWRRFHCDEFSAANAFRNHQPNLSTRQEKFVSSENKNQLLSSVDYSTEELLKLFCQQYWIICKFWETTSMDGSFDANNFLNCSIFGRGMHLQRFAVDGIANGATGQLTRCAFRGARPMIDNRFFIVQLSTANDSDADDDGADGRRALHNTTPSKQNAAAVEATLFRRISKVVVLIKPHAECVTTQKLYEASSSPQLEGGGSDDDVNMPLLGAFSDGTTEVLADDGHLIRSAIEVVRVVGDGSAEFSITNHHLQRSSTASGHRRGGSSVVELRFHYLDTIVRIRREASDRHLSVFIRAPRRLMYSEYDGMPTAQLCFSGTRMGASDEAPSGCSAASDCHASNSVTNVVMDNNDVCAGGESASTAFVRIALSDPVLFQECVLAALYRHRFLGRRTGNDGSGGVVEFIPSDVAQSKCALAGVRDAFFDACFFDAITTPRWRQAATEVEAVCQPAVDAQRFADATLSASGGRQSTDIYTRNAALTSRLMRRCTVLRLSLVEDDASDDAAPTACYGSFSFTLFVVIFAALPYAFV